MPEMLPIETPHLPQRQGGRFRELLLSGLVLFAGLLIFYLWFGPQRNQVAPVAVQRLPFGPAERDYAQHIRLENISLSRAENFLHQEVTTVSCELINGGSRTLSGIELTLEFSDDLRQVVLRETRTVLARPSSPLTPGERRTIEISFEHLPSSWNMQQPVIRVSGLLFAPAK